MLIYLDLLFILNLWIDYLLLITTNIVMKYKVNYKKAFISALIGALSTFLVFINNDILLILLKVIICTLMQFIMNGYKGIKTLLENVFYFYLISIILAGFFYLFSIDNLNIKEKYILLFITTPVVLYINKKEIKKLNTYYKQVYSVTIIINNNKYYFNALLDTGNNLYDQYKHNPISLIYSNDFDNEKYILVPIETANNKSLLKCVKVDKLIVDNIVINNALIGLSENKFNIQDINMILHKDILGG